MFSASLVLIWVVALVLGCKSAGFSPDPPAMKWHPAYWFAEGVCLGKPTFMTHFGAAMLVFGGVAGALGVVGGVIGLSLLAPLPLLLLDFARRDSRLRSVDYVFFNPFRPVSEQPMTVTAGGRQSEVFQIVYLYIPDAVWEEMMGLMDENEQSYLARKRVAKGLFRSEVDSDFMLVFDSLRLTRFVVHPENAVAMQAFVDALSSSSVESSLSAFDPPDADGPDIPVEEGEEEYHTGESVATMEAVTGVGRKDVTSSGKGRAKIPMTPEGEAQVHQASPASLDFFTTEDT